MRVLLIAYDNDSFISWFPQGLAYIAAALRLHGHDVEICNQDVYHYPDSYLTAYLNREHFDVVGLGACGGYYQYRKVLSVCRAIRNSRNSPILMLGGHLPSPEPEFFLRKMEADVIVMGEGEETVVDLMDALSNRRDLKSVDGIAFLQDGQVVVNQRRPLIADVDSIPLPAWDMFPMDHYALLRDPNIKNSERCLPVLSGRGCPFKCNFCYRMDEGFRPRSAESIMEEIEILAKKYLISYIAFSDELLMSSPERTKTLCEAFLSSGLRFRWACNGRLNYARPDVLALMKRAGCVFINYGIESIDDVALKRMRKNLTVKQIVEGVENTIQAGISPGLNIIFGNLGETRASLDSGVDFLLKYEVHAELRTIRPVTPYPGTELYNLAVERGVIKGCEDFYENKHLNSDLFTVNFSDLTDDEAYAALYSANERLLKSFAAHNESRYKDTLRKLYIEKDASFRGFRQS